MTNRSFLGLLIIIFGLLILKGISSSGKSIANQAGVQRDKVGVHTVYHYSIFLSGRRAVGLV